MASISVQGDVSPCSFLGGAFESGSVRERPFEAIWREGHAFRRLRGGSGEEDRFTGGCRARSQFFAGSAFEEDPWQARADGRRPGRVKLPVVGGPLEGSWR
ncbi:SPASM domain-containing protein [Sorangium sp. So ce1128]